MASCLIPRPQAPLLGELLPDPRAPGDGGGRADPADLQGRRANPLAQQNCKWLSEIYHENAAWLNPDTAAARGIANGDMVRVRSEVGEITIKARVTPAEPGVVSISFHCGHWRYGRYASGNATPDEMRSDVRDPDAHRICGWATTVRIRTG